VRHGGLLWSSFFWKHQYQLSVKGIVSRALGLTARTVVVRAGNEGLPKFAQMTTVQYFAFLLIRAASQLPKDRPELIEAEFHGTWTAQSLVYWPFPGKGCCRASLKTLAAKGADILAQRCIWC
jgi:hypothetical protein